MPVAMNDIELDVIMFGLMTSVIDEISFKLLEALKDKIRAIVYNPYHPKYYTRHKENGGFLEDWTKTSAKIDGRNVTSTIEEDPYSMMLDSENYIHGSPDWVIDDVRELLAEIINEGESGIRFGEGFWRSPRRFWEATIELLNNGWIEKQIEKAFKSRGVKYIRN